MATRAAALSPVQARAVRRRAWFHGFLAGVSFSIAFAALIALANHG